MTAQKRDRHKKSSALESLLADSKTNRSQSLVNPPNELKISDAIKLILEPYLSSVKTLEDYRNFVSLACTAWNLSLGPQEEWVEEIGLLVSQMPDMDDKTREAMMRTILSLAIRKHQLYPDNKRSIMDFRVTQTGRNYQIAIASSPPSII